MNQIVKRFAKGVAGSLIILVGISLTTAPEASAHGIDKPRYVDHHSYGYRRAHPVLPRWLRAKRDFQHWYFHSHYRFMRRLSWQRLYDLYLYDTRRSRRAWRRRHDHDFCRWDDRYFSERRRWRRHRG